MGSIFTQRCLFFYHFNDRMKDVGFFKDFQCVYIYINIYFSVCIYIYIHREREREAAFMNTDTLIYCRIALIPILGIGTRPSLQNNLPLSTWSHKGRNSVHVWNRGALIYSQTALEMYCSPGNFLLSHVLSFASLKT